MNTSVNCIALTGLNANDNPGPGVGVARAIREEFGSKVKIIGLAYENLEPGIYLGDLISKTYKIPYPAAGPEALFDRLKYIHKHEQIDVIIPNFDAELANFIKLESSLNSIGISTFLPTADQLNYREKINLKAFGEKHGLEVPDDRQINKISELAEAGEHFGYPMVVKGKFYEAYVVQNLVEAEKSFNKLYGKWGLPIITQQFIKGTEINIAGLGDGTGKALSVIPMKKLYITDKGKAWAGITVEDESLIDLANKFAAACHWRGGFELEVMKDEQARLWIMEINPRFPAWIYLTAAAGQNQPSTLVKLARGESIPSFNGYQSGKMFIRYAWDNIVDVAEFQQIAALGEK